MKTTYAFLNQLISRNFCKLNFCNFHPLFYLLFLFCKNSVKSSYFNLVDHFDGIFSTFTEPVFRGCADAQYAFAPGCNRDLQSVQIVIGKKSVDVEIYLCFCNDEKCNTDLSGAKSIRSFSVFGLLISVLTTVFFYKIL